MARNKALPCRLEACLCHETTKTNTTMSHSSMVVWCHNFSKKKKKKGRNGLLLTHGRVVTLIPAHGRVA